MMALILFSGVVAGLGLTLLVSPFLPHQVNVKTAMANLSVDPQKVQQRAQKLSREEKIGSWVMAHLPESKVLGKLFSVDPQNLNILAIPEISYWYRRCVWGLGGSLLPLFFVVVGTLGGQSISVPFMMIFVGAVCGWLLYGSRVDARARTAREEFSRAVATYLEGLAMRRGQGANTSTAAASAADAADTWVFARIRNRIMISHHQGRQPWDALNDLGKELQVRELSDLALILKQSGENDTQIYEALRSHAELINGRILTDQHEKANAATERLSLFFPLVALVALAMLLYPIVMSFSSPI